MSISTRVASLAVGAVPGSLADGDRRGAVLLGARGADELALADQRVLPRTLTDAGHQFRHRTLRAAFAHELGAEEVPTSL